MFRSLTTLSVAAVALAALPAVAADAPSAAEKAAIFKAAGFKAKGDTYTRCADDVSASHEPGSIELQDLNGDGTAEAWVREGSVYCYGNTGQAFVLLGKGSDGKWSVLLDEVGIAVAKDTKHKGWPDIEVGGPGMGPFPVFRYNGKKYVK
ncbi:MAG: hypothetical protein GC190_03220 [Alphaproteobacteria bacterium]|nr:hypothetical protein [Alphaproteobacteria bacterium]